eukprot:gb/GECH01012895.1/.p1 GENE.gb/GECH01012895.1/~~gb/GECH01012895.1/.p1  ORF type:complete len:618 (+),score=138.97 gb/GECH01012895.1/:1-1854(+)
MTNNTVTLQPQDAPIERVTVYNDRANIKRVAQVKLPKGVQRVVFDNLPSCVDTNSIRVDGRGDAVMLEVSHKTLYHGDENKEQRDEEKENIKKELIDIEDQQTKLENKKDRINNRSHLLDKARQTIHNTINNNTTTRNSSKPDASPHPPVGLSHIVSPSSEGSSPSPDHLRRFLQWYSREQQHQDEALRAVEEEQERLTAEKDKLQLRRDQLDKPLSHTGVRGYCVVVTVDSAEDENETELSLEYIVTQASWEAAYDMRFNSAENSFVVTYHGVIRQNTSEAWRNVELALSTAQPSLGGYPPHLDTLDINIARAHFVHHAKKKQKKGLFGGFGGSGGGGFGGNGAGRISTIGVDFATEGIEDEDEEEDESEGEEEPSIGTATTVVNKGVTSSTFGISRPATIPADNLPHKVVIADHLSFEHATFSYKTVPRRVDKAFLKVKSKNETDYDFLAGKVSVYFDGSFVVHSSITDVMVNQEFSTYVGADPSIGVEYKPIIRQRQNKGVLRGHSLTTVKRMAVVTNHKNVAAKISVIDLIPQSNDREISVHYVEPHFTEKTTEFEEYHIPQNDRSIVADTLKLSKQGFVTWKLTVPAGETSHIPLEYQVQWPNDKQLNQKDF